jgi:hypothetical protein
MRQQNQIAMQTDIIPEMAIGADLAGGDLSES